MVGACHVACSHQEWRTVARSLNCAPADIEEA
jgi:hypothetical protein